MKERTASNRNYPSCLLSSVVRLLNVQETLHFRNIRLYRLQYFFAFPLAIIFAKIQEVLFLSDFSLFGLDAVTMSSGSYCVGAGILFMLSNKKNISVISKLSSAIAALGLIFWLLLPDGKASFGFAVLFMAGIGGCTVSGGYAYAFVLNNTERFLGAVLVSLFYSLMKIQAGLSWLSPAVSRAFMAFLVVGIGVCLMLFKTKDFDQVQDRREKGLGAAVWLMMYFFISMYFIERFFNYIPGAAAPKLVFFSGAFGMISVLICIILHMLLSQSVWIMCNLFFISMVGAYALMYATPGSLLCTIAASLNGLELIGYTAGLYLLGCVLNKFGDFRLFKLIAVVLMPISALAYLVPDLLDGLPLVLHATAMTASSILFIIFMLLTPAYSKYLFLADWSDDFKRPAMTEEQKKIVRTNRFDNLKLTRREKEIAELLLRGFTAKQIASELDIAFDTVKYHTKNLYKKLGICGRSELFALFTVPMENSSEMPSLHK